jgi:cell shape-determining protein MreD
MTPASAVFWVYLAAYSSIGGIAALVLGLVARFTARPFDTPRRFGVFLVFLGIVLLFAVFTAALCFNLASSAGTPSSFRANMVVGPFLTAPVIFVWAAGFPLSRILPRRN